MATSFINIWPTAFTAFYFAEAEFDYLDENFFVGEKNEVCIFTMYLCVWLKK